MEYLPVLRACPLFDGVEEQDLPIMLDCLGAKTIQAEKNAPIFRQGDPARYVGIVLAGQVQILQEDYYGNRSILGRAGPGELFGEAFACAGVEALPVSVVAAEHSCVMLLECGRITTSCCNACAFHSRMIVNLLRVMAAKNLQFHQKLQITSRRTTREKLMSYLLAQAQTRRASQFTIPFDRQELADYLGVDRSGLSAEISRLKAEGVIDCHRSTFKIL
jgi:CRP-like cAMP-binding protein